MLLMVEDDKALSASLSEFLKSKKYLVEVVHDGQNAIDYLESSEYDAIILDWDLPDISGIEVLSRFRSRGGQTPVLMLTGKADIRNKEEGFGAGADDYLTKPFHEQELVARIAALLRRPAAFKGNLISMRNFEIDTLKRRFFRDGVEIELQPMEFNLLEFLLRYPDHVFSTEDILRRCWGAVSEVSIDGLYSCVKRIRKKIDVEGQTSIISTVHAVGYCFNSK